MSAKTYKYIIVGGGLAGASAAAGIRELDKDGSILLIGEEGRLPYNRPPLSKKLWFGKMKVEEIFEHGREFYEENKIELALGDRAVRIDAAGKTVACASGKVYKYDKLLLATGGTPRKLPIPGGDIDGVRYYRYLDDYERIRAASAEGRSAVVIGGGFIGSEMAAALNTNKVDVTMIFPSPYICDRVFPEYLGKAVMDAFRKRGIKIIQEKPASITKEGKGFITRTDGGKTVESDIVIAGIGIAPETALAKGAGLATENGVKVNEYLETSDPDIYAAGDNAMFPYQALGEMTRVEHWDNAINQGKAAGRNMAGAGEQYTYMPYFFSDLFEFGYEAVGEVSSGLLTFADWEKENEKGVVYYLRDGRVRGVMLCNIWKKVEAARELIRRAERMTPESLRGAIQFHKKAG